MADKFNMLNEDIEILNNIQFKMFKDELEDEDIDDEAGAGATSSFTAYHKADGELLAPEVVVGNKSLYVAQSFKDFEIFVLDNVKNNQQFITTKKISYDIETNAESPISNKAEIIGFSISFSADSGIYLVREALDHKMSDTDWNNAIKLLLALFKVCNKIIIHNMEYEIPYTINCLNYELKNDIVEDTMIKRRILYPGEPSGLKPTAAILLGYQDWDVELSSYTKSMKKIITEFTKLATVKRANLESKLSDLKLYNKFFELHRYTPINPVKLYEELLTGGYVMTDLVTSFVALFQLLALNDILEQGIFDSIKQAIIAVVEDGGLQTDVIPYNLIPMKIIAKYGAIDSVATYELNEYLDKQFDIKNSDIKSMLKAITADDTFDFFDFRKGYEMVKAQFDAGINLQMAGAFWDDSVAEQELIYYQTKLNESWLRLFDNTAFRDVVKANYEPTILTTIIKDTYQDLLDSKDTIGAKKLQALFSSQGAYVLQASQVKFLDKVIDEGLVGRPLVVKVTKLASHFYREILHLFGEDADIAFEKMLAESAKNTDYKQLTKMYNPTSSASNNVDLVNNLLNTETLKYGTLYTLCYKQLMENRFWERYPVNETTKPVINLFTFLERVKKHSEDISDSHQEIAQKKLFDAFIELFNKIDVQSSSEMLEIFMQAMQFKIESLSDLSLIDAYHRFKATGVDIENKETWSPEFAWLYHFRMYRKSLKMITTYLNGKVGRKSLTTIKKAEVSNLLARRLRKYDHEMTVEEDEMLILSTEFKVCSAETGRWKSGMHTIPAGSTIKNIYRSRYKGGVICAPDYSQMEVRAIAASAKENIMLQVFKNGEDIHLKTASYVWKKPEDQITDSERRFSKAVTFAVLYGAAEKNIADSFLGGDYNAAKEIMDNFYKGYPKLKTWIDAMHSLFNQIGAVPLASSRMINIKLPAKDDPKYKFKKSKGFRQSQNYPIQGLSNDIAGYALYLAINYFKENNMKSKGISFVHDALYFDIHPHELLDATFKIDEIMNEYPQQAFDLPAIADLVIGVSMGQELKVEEKGKISSTEGYFVLSGFSDDFDELIKEWKQVYSSVEWEDVGKVKDIYVKNEDLFIPKRTVSRYLGTKRQVIKRKVYIKF